MNLHHDQSLDQIQRNNLFSRFEAVDHQDDGSFYHQVVLELVEVEELPAVFAAEEVRLEMSGRFKVEGNEQFTAGDYTRSERGDAVER